MIDGKEIGSSIHSSDPAQSPFLQTNAFSPTPSRQYDLLGIPVNQLASTVFNAAICRKVAATHFAVASLSVAALLRG